MPFLCKHRIRPERTAERNPKLVGINLDFVQQRKVSAQMPWAKTL